MSGWGGGGGEAVVMSGWGGVRGEEKGSGGGSRGDS